MQIVSRIVILAMFFSSVGQGLAAQQGKRIKRLDGSTISTTEIEQLVARLMREAHVTGISIAILNDARVVYVKSFGSRNKEEQKPLTENSVMRGASFTKAVFEIQLLR